MHNHLVTVCKLIRERRVGDLANAIQLLQAQLDILRKRHPDRIRFTPAERRLLRRFSKPLKGTAAAFLSLVQPATCDRWGRADRRRRTERMPRYGRPRTGAEIEAIVIRFAEENNWGCTRVFAELRKLGLAGKTSRTTVRSIMARHGFDPDPRRGPGTWDEFIRTHQETLWSCDFFTVPVQTPSGTKDQYALFFKQVGSRRVWLAGVTPYPDGAWTAQQARNFCMHLQDTGQRATHVIRDRDGKFLNGFDNVFQAEGITVVRSAPLAPEMNGYAESFVGTIKRECLSHFVIANRDHLDYLIREFIDYHNTVRPHRGLGGRPIGLPDPREHTGDIHPEDIVCVDRLGGRLRHYEWKKVA